MRPELDQWKPGEHTGTFRGNNLAFVAATEALAYWEDNNLADAVVYKAGIVAEALNDIKAQYPELRAEVRGKGLIYGLEIPLKGFAGRVARMAFDEGLVLELSGADDQVLKILPPLVIEEETLKAGLDIIGRCIGSLLERKATMMHKYVA